MEYIFTFIYNLSFLETGKKKKKLQSSPFNGWKATHAITNKTLNNTILSKTVENEFVNSIDTFINSSDNYKKKGLRDLLKKINNKEVDKIIVLYKDRLLRFGFELVEYMASLNGCEIEILDSTEKTQQEELVEDLIQIVTVFSCRLQGKRANKAKKMIKELIEDDTCEKS